MSMRFAPTHTTMTTHDQFARDQFSRDYNRADLMILAQTKNKPLP